MARVGIYGWGVVAPGARDVAALEALLERQGRGLHVPGDAAFGGDLFAVGDPDFDQAKVVSFIAARKGDAYAARLTSKMGDNVLFALGAVVQAVATHPALERIASELDEACHVYVGSGVGDLPQSYAAERALDRATRAWNRYWAAPERCAARRLYEGGTVADALPLPPEPASLPIDSFERFDALRAWDAFWAARSTERRAFEEKIAAVEAVAGVGAATNEAVLADIRRRVRSVRSIVAEQGCPPPPWMAVSADLIWNIQNAPAAQITMALGVHGAAWAPVAACSTFGVALKCGRDAILRGDAKMAIVGTTDPRPDRALMGAFHDARVIAGGGEVNSPFTTLRGTHVSGGACVWILGEEDAMRARGIDRPTGGWVEGIAISSDAEHIITPSLAGPKRAIRRALDEAGVAPDDVAIADLHATGTPGDLHEVAIVEEFIGARTKLTARKGQLGHGMANSGGWELTALALGLARGRAFGTAIPRAHLHPLVPRVESVVCDEESLAPGAPRVGLKLMLGIGGVTCCVVLRASER